MNAGLDSLRNDLIERGLLVRAGDGYSLTPAGNAEAERLIDSLAKTRIDEDFAGRRVKWNFTPKARREPR